MDFSFSEDQEEVRQLAARIFGDLSTPERLKEVEATEDGVDRKLWSELAAAGLLGLGVPEADGGAGLGFVDTCVVIEEAGRAAAAVPLVPVAVMACGPLVAHGSVAQRARWLAPAISGEVILSAALVEPGGDPAAPTTVARPDGGGFKLDGAKTCVPAGMVADALVVPARLGDGDGGIGLFLVDMSDPGVTRTRQDPTDGHPEAHVELAGAAGDPLVLDDGEAALAALLERTSAALCVQLAGACKAAVKLTAEYTSERKQFDKAIATFQAVGQRAADAYIDAEAVWITAWQAAYRLGAGLPAAAEVAVAKFWADEGAQRVVHAAHHLHGGVGVDRDYPLHRYFLLTKHLALTLGGSTLSLLRLGDLLAAEPA